MLVKCLLKHTEVPNSVQTVHGRGSHTGAVEAGVPRVQGHSFSRQLEASLEFTLFPHPQAYDTVIGMVGWLSGERGKGLASLTLLSDPWDPHRGRRKPTLGGKVAL